MSDKTTCTPEEQRERDDLAAYMFPSIWPKIRDAPGKSKTRQQYRQRAEKQVKLDDLSGAGCSCASCGAFQRIASIGMICEVGSDFNGYLTAKADGLCSDWHAKGLTHER